MLKQVLAIVVIGSVALTSVAACASDWAAGANGYAPLPAERYVHNGPPVRYVAPRYYPAYRWAPAPFRWAPPYGHWYPAYGYHRYGYQPGYHNNGRNDWNDRNDWNRRNDWNDHDQRRDWDRDDHRGDDDDRNDWHGR